MKYLLLTVTVVAFTLAACSPALPADGETVSWEQTVDLLRGGYVTMVAELHSGEVQLTLTNGAVVSTFEQPYSGAIFDEVANCGQPCEGIVLAME